MRAIIQRVLSSSVVVEGETIASIGKGLCVLVGITQGDGEPEIEHIVRKVLNMKLWPDPDTDKPWQRSVMTMGYDVLFVSQFTLYAQTHKGHRPDFGRAMAPNLARPLYSSLVDAAKKSYCAGSIQSGQFGAEMMVQIANHGPVTISLDTPGAAPSTAAESHPKRASAGGAVSPEEAELWLALPTVPRHNNKAGRPTPEHIAAAKAAKEAKRNLVDKVLARLQAGDKEGTWSVKAVEIALQKAAQNNAVRVQPSKDVNLGAEKHAAAHPPNVTAEETIESLRKQLGRLQDRVAALENRRQN